MKIFVCGIILALGGVEADAETLGEAQDNATITYYVQHTQERKDIIHRCDANPDQTRTESDCILAKKADNQAGVNDVKNGVDSTIQGAADFFHHLGGN